MCITSDYILNRGIFQQNTSVLNVNIVEEIFLLGVLILRMKQEILKLTVKYILDSCSRKHNYYLLESIEQPQIKNLHGITRSPL